MRDCSDANLLVLLAYWFLNAFSTLNNNNNKLPLQISKLRGPKYSIYRVS